MLTNPAMLVFALVSAFFVMTVLASAGGALGSRFSIKNSREAAFREPLIPRHDGLRRRELEVERPLRARLQTSDAVYC